VSVSTGRARHRRGLMCLASSRSLSRANCLVRAFPPALRAPELGRICGTALGHREHSFLRKENSVHGIGSSPAAAPLR